MIKTKTPRHWGQCISILLKFNMSNEMADMKGSVG